MRLVTRGVPSTVRPSYAKIAAFVSVVSMLLCVTVQLPLAWTIGQIDAGISGTPATPFDEFFVGLLAWLFSGVISVFVTAFMLVSRLASELKMHEAASGGVTPR